MTCIVALKSKDRIYMGGDSACVSTSSMISRALARPKVFQKGSYLVGCSGSARVSDIIQHAIRLPEPTGNLDAFLCTDFVDALRDGLKIGGSMKANTEEEEANGSVLFAVNGRIFCMYSDFQITEYTEPYTAIGCGREYSLGYLHGTYSEKKNPYKLVEKALAAAEHFSIGVQGPYYTMEMPC